MSPNQHLYKLERRRADALAAISAASREIATSPDLQGTLRLVMDKAAQTLPMDAGALFLLDALRSGLQQLETLPTTPPAPLAGIPSVQNIGDLRIDSLLGLF